MAQEQPAPQTSQGILDLVRGYAVLVILVIVVQIILAFIIIRTLVIGRQEKPHEETIAAAEEPEEVPEKAVLTDRPAVILDIKEDLLTNAANTDRIRFVKAHVQLGLTSEKALSEVEQIEPKVVDAILGIVMMKSVEEMDDPSDREVMKDEMKITINSYLTQGEVVKIYLTSFLIQ